MSLLCASQRSLRLNAFKTPNGSNLLQQTIDRATLSTLIFQFRNLHPLLLHRITLTNCHGIILQRLVVNRYTIWSSNRIHPSVSSADSILLFVVATEIRFQLIENSFGFFIQAIFLHQRQHSNLIRSQRCRNRKHHTLIAFFAISRSKFLFFVRVRQDRKEQPI